jgi:hypothetical protein
MPSRSPAAEQAALRVCDALYETINAHDPERHICALNFPHVRIASGQVTVWDTVDALRATYLPRIAHPLEPGWHHSTMDQKDVIHSAPDKVHVAVQYTRWTADHQPLATYQALWVVTCVQGHWGVQVRSSFAP